MSNFIQNCIRGEAFLSEVDNYIDQWHNSETDMPLHTFLGMSKQEYALFVQDEIYLTSIVTAHKEKVDNIENIINNPFAMEAISE
jgi:hypothetical protein